MFLGSPRADCLADIPMKAMVSQELFLECYPEVFEAIAVSVAVVHLHSASGVMSMALTSILGPPTAESPIP